MQFIIVVLTHTPAWVFAVLAYLVWMGVKGLGMRTLPVTRVWLTPAIFIVWGLTGVFGHASAAAVAPAWIVGALLGAGPGALTSPRHVEYDRTQGRVRFRGSPFPLIRNVVIFVARYVLAVVAATSAHHAAAALWSAGVSGASAGYFVGWSLMFLRRLGGAPKMSLATA